MCIKRLCAHHLSAKNTNCTLGMSTGRSGVQSNSVIRRSFADAAVWQAVKWASTKSVVPTMAPQNRSSKASLSGMSGERAGTSSAAIPRPPCRSW